MGMRVLSPAIPSRVLWEPALPPLAGYLTLQGAAILLGLCKTGVPALPYVPGWARSLLQPGAVPSATPELAMGMGIAGLRLDSELAGAAACLCPL